ncbi:hypothetical protein ACP275_07G073400 [Erythranthe tilingii]
MSRCFPFPPPGYERKHRPEDLDLLKEAKRKEKKHKKEKKDKERSKDKSKKEKDGGDEKHRDKKDRKGKDKDKSKKEKNKDKKKEKEDHGKDKEKSSISEESTVAAESQPKLNPEGHHIKDRSSFSNEGEFSGLLFQGQKRGNEESKFVLELDRRIREEKGQGSQLPERLTFEDKKDQENGDNKNKRVDRKIDPFELRNEFSENTNVQNLIPTPKNKVEGIPKPAVEQNGYRLEDNEKYKEIGGGIKQVETKKDRDKESREKRKDGEKEKKKSEKSKRKKEEKKGELDKLKDDGFTANKSVDLLKESNSNAVVNDGNIKKRKDMGANGFLHDSETRPHKIQKPAFPHHSTENGRKLEKLEPFPTPIKPSQDKQAVVPNPNSDRLDHHKERLMNGIIEIPKPSPPKLNPSAATAKIAEASKIKARTVSKVEDPIATSSRRPRPPHPDSKYLAEVLTVPKMTLDLSENDDQDWLFSKKAPTKPKTESVGPDEDLRVWSEAVHIEAADVIALPYVIPY